MFKSKYENVILSGLYFEGMPQQCCCFFQQGFQPPMLIFVQSKERAKELFHELIYDGINVDVIHSDRTQAQVSWMSHVRSMSMPCCFMLGGQGSEVPLSVPLTPGPNFFLVVAVACFLLFLSPNTWHNIAGNCISKTVFSVYSQDVNLYYVIPRY